MSIFPKVAIAVPFHHDVKGGMALSGMAMACRSAREVEIMPCECSGCYIEDNRNGAVFFALKTGIDFDWLLWIDGDMIFPPSALLRLMAHGKDIVGANYRSRTPPFNFVGHYIDGRDTQLMEPGLHPMGHLPTGLLLTRFDIYRRLAYPWFKPGLNFEPRDDVYFCNYARAAGYEVWCDHDLTFETRHRGDYDIPWFTPEQLIPAGAPIPNVDPRLVVEGAQMNMEKSKAEANERAALTGRIVNGLDRDTAERRGQAQSDSMQPLAQGAN